MKGRRITLQTRTRNGRLEDFVKLTTRVRRSPMTGLVDVEAKLDIPPGEAEVIERMILDGTFDVASAQFTSQSIQDRVDELSRRGRGSPHDETIDHVASTCAAASACAMRSMNVRSLIVPGRAAPRCGSREITTCQTRAARLPGTLAPAGQGVADANRVEVAGAEGLRPDAGRRGSAGTLLPISITGTRDQPKFGADIKKALLK